MKAQYIKANFAILILLSLSAILILSFTSYKFFMSNFSDLEKEQNLKNINSVLNIMDKELNYLEDTITDYAKWDDTYSFAKGENNNYLYENFREGSNTLEDLELDFIIFTTLRNKKIYSKYVEEDIYKNSKIFEKNILKKFEHSNDLATIHKDNGKILKYSSNYFYIVKKYITNSDDSVVANGFIYSGKLISNDVLNGMTKIFDEVSIKNTKFMKNNILINSIYLKNSQIKIEENTEKNLLINTIQLYDYKNKYILSLVTKTKRELIKKGKYTILYYNIAISFFLILIFFLIFRNQKVLERYSKTLELQVNEKTKKLLDSNKKLKILSEEDELTKINNRRNFFRLGKKALNQAIENNDEIIISMIDLDNFKNINDSYGHDVGDKVLIHSCNIINNILGSNHIFGRLGGEEFAIIFKDINSEEAYELTEQIRLAIENSFVENEGNKIKYTVSIGFTRNENEKSIDKILKNADELLYTAKNRGKNCIIRER